MPRKQAAIKRRTTLTLPSDSLLQVQKIAHSRQVNLSTVVSEVVAEGLRLETVRRRRNQILENYRAAFTGFSEDEIAILDGVILEPASAGRRR
jgi:hypothetical protein